MTAAPPFAPLPEASTSFCGCSLTYLVVPLAAGVLAYTQAGYSTLKLSKRGATLRCREGTRVASALLHMDLQSSEVRLRWKDGVEGDKTRFRHSQEMLQQATDADSGTPPSSALWC